MITITIRGLTEDCATRMAEYIDAFDDWCGIEYEVKDTGDKWKMDDEK